MRVKLGELYEKYGAIVPAEIIAQENEAFAKGQNYIIVQDDIVEMLDEKKHQEELRQKDYEDVSELRLAGIEAEKRKDINDAIDNYIRCIELGEKSPYPIFHAFAYAYERLIVCLHKVMRINEEVYYIEKYLSHSSLTDTNREKYNKRLQKIQK